MVVKSLHDKVADVKKILNRKMSCITFMFPTFFCLLLIRKIFQS